MKKKILILLSVVSFILIFSSCASNSDKKGGGSKLPGENPDLSETGDDIDITVENLKGTWELFFTNKKRNTTKAMRMAEDDGATVQFLANGTYIEKNSLGEELLDTPGYYTIVGNKPSKQDTLKFSFKSPTTGIDTTSTAYIYQLTKDVFIRQEKYTIKDQKNPSILYNVVDMLYFRRVPVTNPDKTFGLMGKKEKYEFITNDYINGTWMLAETMEQSSTDGVNWGKLNSVYEEANGTTYKFDKTTKKFVETGPNGEVAAEGDYRLIDDVIHYYYLGPNDVPSKTVMMLRDQTANSFTNYRQDVGFSSTTKYTILRQYSHFIKIAD